LAWQIKFDEAAKKYLTKLDKQIAWRITAFLHDRVASLDNPRSMRLSVRFCASDKSRKNRGQL
jgi:mRNA interferase RelE/StbE